MHLLYKHLHLYNMSSPSSSLSLYLYKHLLISWICRLLLSNQLQRLSSASQLRGSDGDSNCVGRGSWTRWPFRPDRSLFSHLSHAVNAVLFDCPPFWALLVTLFDLFMLLFAYKKSFFQFNCGGQKLLRLPDIGRGRVGKSRRPTLPKVYCCCHAVAFWR